MDKSQAQVSSKKVRQEAVKIDPSAVIDLYEIDTRQIQFDLSILSVLPSATAGEEDGIFRFHNSINLTTKEIYFNNLKYVAAPIGVEGFEAATQGTLPRPKISIAVDFNGEAVLSKLKTVLSDIGDLTGAKFTRRRTFLKFIDKDKESGGSNDPNLIKKISNHDPDPNAVLSYDVYFIDRKTNETNRTLEFELATSLDLESASIPNRLVIQDRCQWRYRGAGCCYTNNLRKNVHGLTNADDGVLAFKNTFKTVRNAMPVATAADEPIFSDSIAASNGILGTKQGLYVDQGEWVKDQTYKVGEGVYLVKNGIEYHFVCKEQHDSLKENMPPNVNYWIADQCSKSVQGCKMRFNGTLPYGGFPAVAKIPR